MNGPSTFDVALGLARANDPGTSAALARMNDPELVGELQVMMYRTGTDAARSAVHEALREPYRRGKWQGFKRIFKLAEAALDTSTFTLAAHVVDQAPPGTRAVSRRTLAYLGRRCYRHLKRVAHDAPDRFFEHVSLLLPRYDEKASSRLLARLFRLSGADEAEAPAQGFVARSENPFVPDTDDASGDDAFLDLDDDELTSPPASEPAPEPDVTASPRKKRGPWKGPIFPELWLCDPGRLVALLGETRQEAAASAIARLLTERAGDALLGVPLDAFYALLRHGTRAAWCLALSQIAARARSSLIRVGELVPFLERARRHAARVP